MAARKAGVSVEDVAQRFGVNKSFVRNTCWQAKVASGEPRRIYKRKLTDKQAANAIKQAEKDKPWE